MRRSLLKDSHPSPPQITASNNERIPEHSSKPRRRSVIIKSEPISSAVVFQNENLRRDDEKLSTTCSSRKLCTVGIVKTSLIRKFFALLVVGVIFAVAVMKNHVSEKSRTMKEHPAARFHRGLNKKSIDCIVHELGTIATPGFEDAPEPDRFTCGVENHGPTVMLVGNGNTFFGQKLRSGITSLNIPTGLVSAEMEVYLDDPLATELISITNRTGSKRVLREAQQKSERTLIADYHGFFKTLIVRVSDDRGNSPTSSAADLSNQVFFNSVSMASQYRACSNNQLLFTPAFGGSDIVDGVVDIVVDVDLRAGYGAHTCVAAADYALSLKYDIGTSHTYVMYICPEVVDFGSVAGYGDINGSKSWYSDVLGSSTYVQMHEIGHNLGFFHSGIGKIEYADPTGVMGGNYDKSEGWGRMCFNAAKTWKSGWYADQHATVDLEKGTYSGNLVDVNSVITGRYQKEDVVVVKVEGQSGYDLYFMLHRLEGVTSDMKDDFKDTQANGINIVSQMNGSASDLVSHLTAGEEYIQDNWSNSGQALHIKVCSIADKYEDGGARVLVFLDFDAKEMSCDDMTVPTISPTVLQTRSQTSSTQGHCLDSMLKIKINGIKRSCAWVSASNTQQRCERPGVASHCPSTCDETSSCAADSDNRFQLRDGTMEFQSCDWVRRTSTKERCRLEGVASTCRATCGTFKK